MTISKSIAAVLLSLTLALSGATAAQSTITPEQVAVAMGNAGFNISSKQVVLLTDVVASAAATLKVESMQPWANRGTLVRLICVKPAACLPFFVAVRGSQAQSVASLIAGPSPAEIKQAKPDSISFAVRAGSRQTLFLVGEHVHVQLPVVCLESGAVGKTISVASLDHKQTYMAEVGGNRVLTGRLQ